MRSWATECPVAVGCRGTRSVVLGRRGTRWVRSERQGARCRGPARTPRRGGPPPLAGEARARAVRRRARCGPPVPSRGMNPWEARQGPVAPRGARWRGLLPARPVPPGRLARPETGVGGGPLEQGGAGSGVPCLRRRVACIGAWTGGRSCRPRPEPSTSGVPPGQCTIRRGGAGGKALCVPGDTPAREAAAGAPTRFRVNRRRGRDGVCGGDRRPPRW